MNASLGPLTTITIWICVVGVVAALLVWLLGRRDVRAGVVAAGKRVAGQSAEITLPDSPVTSWIVNHAVGVRWGVLVVGLIVLALVTSSWLGIVLAIVVVLLLEGVPQLHDRAVAVPRAGERRGDVRLSGRSVPSASGAPCVAAPPRLCAGAEAGSG